MSLNKTDMDTTETETQTIRRLIRCGKLDEASDLCISTIRSGYFDKELYIFFILFLIRMKEQIAGYPEIFNISHDPDVLIKHYRALKFFIRRQEFSQMEPLQGELYSYCRETNTSAAALETIAEHSTLEPETIIEKIRKGLTAHE